MAGDRYEPNRFLGFPLPPPDSRGRRGRPGEDSPGRRDRQGEEPQRVMGFPVDWFGDIGIDRDLSWSLAHPVRAYRRWLRRRRLGPYATDEDGPGREQ